MKGRILVVDDEANIRRALAKLLSQVRPQRGVCWDGSGSASAAPARQVSYRAYGSKDARNRRAVTAPSD